jgi:hypothetical protein
MNKVGTFISLAFDISVLKCGAAERPEQRPAAVCKDRTQQRSRLKTA